MSVLDEGGGANSNVSNKCGLFYLSRFIATFLKLLFKPAPETLLNTHKICENVLYEGQIKFCGESLVKIVKVNRSVDYKKKLKITVYCMYCTL
jgi:hypothetical protein